MEDNGTMMAAEPAATYTPTVYDTVISYLHSNHMPIETKRAVYRQLQSEVADENLAYMKRRLKEYAKLEAGWDGDDAEALIPQIVDFMEELLRTCDSRDFSDWSLFPNVNGTLLLQRNDAAISVGLTEYSFFAESKGKAIGKDHDSLSVDSVINTIKTINHYVG